MPIEAWTKNSICFSWKILLLVNRRNFYYSIDLKMLRFIKIRIIGSQIFHSLFSVCECFHKVVDGKPERRIVSLVSSSINPRFSISAVFLETSAGLLRL